MSEPIAAASDDAALFELLEQVGCGMPRQNRAGAARTKSDGSEVG